MSSSPSGTPADHYRAAETALAALAVDDARTLHTTAIVSAILATVPALRGQHRHERHAPTSSDPASALAVRRRGRWSATSSSMLTTALDMPVRMTLSGLVIVSDSTRHLSPRSGRRGSPPAHSA